MPIDDVKIETYGFTRDDIKKLARDEIKDITAKVVDEAIDDGRINIKDNVDAILQADKKIWSKVVIEYDDQADITSFTFPACILPVKFYLDTAGYYFYFDYESGEIINSNGTSVGYINTTADNRIVLVIEGDYSDAGCEDLLYLIFDLNTFADSSSYCNWYAILNPSAGTKLYKHVLTDGNYTLELICDIPTVLDFTEITTQGDLYSELYMGNHNVVSFSGAGFPLIYDINNIDFSLLRIDNGSISLSELDDWDLSQTTDTVTEL